MPPNFTSTEDSVRRPKKSLLTKCYQANKKKGKGKKCLPDFENLFDLFLFIR